MKFTEEHRLNISKGGIGRKLTPEHLEKFTMKGRKQSDEHIRKRIDSFKQNLNK